MRLLTFSEFLSRGEKSWEPKGNLDCDDLLREYHVGLLAREIQYSPPVSPALFHACASR